MSVEVLWTGTTKNVKTGPVPTGWIGATIDQSARSCEAVGCPLRRQQDGGSGQCYAWAGTPNMAFHSMVKARARGKVYDLAGALFNRVHRAKMVRIGAIGDPAVLSPMAAAFIRSKVRAAGLALVGYTHGWRFADHWRGHLMASCDSLAECDEAIDQGWRACVILPVDHPGRGFATPAGRVGVVCPAQRGPVTCNDCRLCDGSTRGPVIGFIDHGPEARFGGA